MCSGCLCSDGSRSLIPRPCPSPRPAPTLIGPHQPQTPSHPTSMPKPYHLHPHPTRLYPKRVPSHAPLLSTSPLHEPTVDSTPSRLVATRARARARIHLPSALASPPACPFSCPHPPSNRPHVIQALPPPPPGDAGEGSIDTSGVEQRIGAGLPPRHTSDALCMSLLTAQK